VSSVREALLKIAFVLILCLILCFKIQLSLPHSRAAFDVVSYNRSFFFRHLFAKLLLISSSSSSFSFSSSSSSLAYSAYSLNSASFRMSPFFLHLPSNNSVHFINVCILCSLSLWALQFNTSPKYLNSDTSFIIFLQIQFLLLQYFSHTLLSFLSSFQKFPSYISVILFKAFAGFWSSSSDLAISPGRLRIVLHLFFCTVIAGFRSLQAFSTRVEICYVYTE
jgi:hypothetical protein